jgi:rhamnulokinase
MDYYASIDIGASSGVFVVGFIENSIIKLEEVHRFENGYKDNNGELCWDLDNIYRNIIEGLIICKKKNYILKTLAIDTWGVDFVLLDENDKIIGNSVSYRDKRTLDMDKELDKLIDENELYKITGIQKQLFNTIYQLLAIKNINPDYLNEASSFLMIPDYLSFLLTGVKSQEYTNATTSNLVNKNTNEWDFDLIEKLNLPKKLFLNKLGKPGEIVGFLKKEISDEIGFKVEVIHAPSHDTASAFLSVPIKDDNSAIISSGTWSLLGVESTTALTTVECQQENFTNEGGYDYRYRFIKNIMGLWVIQNCKKSWNNKYSFIEMENLAKESKLGDDVFIDINDKSLYSPDNMVSAIKNISPVKLQSDKDVLKCVYQSLAKSYVSNFRILEKLTNKKFSRINIVGGGSKDHYLNQLTSDLTNLEVIAGPIEGSSLGNLLVQFIKDNKFINLQEARYAISQSFDLHTFTPKKRKYSE